MVFKEIGIEDKAQIEKYTIRKGEHNCEFTFYNLYVWQILYGNSFAVEDEIMYLRVGKENNYTYALPFGDIEKGFTRLRELTGEQYPNLWAQDGPAFEKFMSLYGKYYDVSCIREEYDYLYLKEDLKNLSGKKYHSKRNHISAFKRQYDYTYEPVSKKNLDDIKRCADIWYDNNSDKMDDEMLVEKKGIDMLISHFDKLDIMGGAIRVNGSIVAFTLGSAVNDETFDIYIEKAFDEYNGAYSVINNEFVKTLPDNIKYINREDDLGIEGLRRSKMSYHPHKFIKKYFLTARDNAAVRRIYTEAFGEDKEFDDKLFSEFAENIRVQKYEGETVSVLFKIPCSINGCKYYYIYAAATDEKMRNKGFMKQLLMRETELSDGPLFLVPSSKELVEFYKNCGFFEAEAVSNGGDIKIEVSKKHEQLSILCDNCPQIFTVMFSESPENAVYEFPFAMQ